VDLGQRRGRRDREACDECSELIPTDVPSLFNEHHADCARCTRRTGRRNSHVVNDSARFAYNDETICNRPRSRHRARGGRRAGRRAAGELR
jgi:hypothetical protein